MSFYPRGDVYYVERFGTQVGCEQRSGRPGIIVSNDENNRHSSAVEIVYLTRAQKTDLPTHVTIRSAKFESTALCEQVTTVSVERLGNYIGRCTKDEMFKVEVAMLKSLGIKVPGLRDLQKELDKVAEAKAEGPREESRPEQQEIIFAVDAKQASEEIIRLRVEREMYERLYKDMLVLLAPSRITVGSGCIQ